VDVLPRYTVEAMGEISAAGSSSGKSSVVGTTYKETPAMNVYRISARGTGGSQSTAVILQSTYSAQN